MKAKKLLASILLCSVMATGVGMSTLTACSNNTPQNPPEETEYNGTITLSESKVSLRPNGNKIIRATLTEDLKDQPVTWTTSDPTIATVSGGLVRGIKAGTVTITATCCGKEATCVVTVWEGAVNEVKDETEEVSSKVTGKTYYVSPTATANGDGSKDNPYEIRTLLDFDHFNDDSGIDWGDPILQPGDTVLVMPGEYNLSERIQIGYSGNYANPITIKNADPTQKATIKFYAMAFNDNNRGVQINGDYFIWDSIDVCGAGDNGMYIGGSYNVVINCEFYDNRDTGLQLGRAYGTRSNVNEWPSYNLIKNCTSYNNYDNETYGENADGFAAKLTVGYGNIFDGCVAYRNSDDGWDLFAKVDSGNIGAVIINNCVAFENGYIAETQESFNKKFPTFDKSKEETNTNSFKTRDGDGNGFKLGGSKMEGEVFVYNSLTFNNRMHGVTDNSNPGVLVVENVTSYNNAAGVDNDEYLAYDKITGELLKDVTIIKNDDDTFTVVKLVEKKDESGNNVYDDGNKEMEKVVVDANVIKNEAFGWITYNENADSCANVDLARQTYSYNHVANVLSILNGNRYAGGDAYRGTVVNSILAGSKGDSYYKIDAVNEYDTNSGDNRDRGSVMSANPVASEVFKELPTLDLGIKGGDGYADYYGYIHHAWRNADGSINVGDLLTQKDANSTYGCVLNKTSYDAYAHWDYSDVTSSKNRQEGTAQAIYDMLYLPIQEENCYQDFQVVARMMGYPIYWESSDTNVLKVSTKVYDSISGSYVNKVEVLRSDEGDKQVTLTATINVGNVAIKTKTFTINVLKNTYKVGDVLVDGVVEDEIIVDQYSGYTLADPVIVNATSDSGRIIDAAKYDLEYKYELATTDDGGAYQSKRSFSSSTSGKWRITLTIKLKDNITLKYEGDNTATYQYYVYVASTQAQVDFVASTEGFYLNKDGFTLYGQPTNPTGTLYVMNKPATEAAPSADELIANGEKVEFRSTSLTLNFKAVNSDAYNVYYVFENADKSAKSAVHKFEVTTKDITTKAEFEEMLAQNSNLVIYRLMNDIDCNGGGINIPFGDDNKAIKFVGYFDGLGHSIKNVKLVNTNNKTEAFGIFPLVKNGTIANVCFENISITDAGKKTGIVGLMNGGSIYNVKVSEITISGQERVGSIVGQISTSGAEESINVIENVEVVTAPKYTIISLNEDKFGYRKYYTLEGGVYTLADTYDADATYYDRVIDIENKSKYMGGLVGYVQAGASGAGWCTVIIRNCYVNVALSGDDYCGGILGRSDDRNVKDNLLIENCYFAGVFKVRVRGAGIIGGFSGAGKTRISGAISLGIGYYGNNRDIVTTAQKNSSGIVGNFSTTADMTVENCFATFGEYNSDYDVTTINAYLLSNGKYSTYWEDEMGYDLKDTWEYVKVDETGAKLAAPYIRIKNVGKLATAN